MFVLLMIGRYTGQTHLRQHHAHPEGRGEKADRRIIIERNAIAARLMQQHGIAIDDLFTTIA